MRRFGPVATAALPLVLLLGAGGCDLTTESPDVSVEPSVEAPLVPRQSFVRVGPDSTDRIPMIDPTGAAADSLFSVDSGDESVVLSKQEPLLEEQSLGCLLPSVNVGSGRRVDLS